MPVEDAALASSLFALLAAALFASGTLLAKRGLQHADSVTGAVIQISVSMLLFGLAAPFSLEARDWLSPAVWVFATVGLLRPSISTILANEATRRLGPTIATTIESTSPFFAVIGGVLFLSERLTPATALGTLGVVAGVVVMSSRGRLPRSWSLWALLFPLGAAIIRSAAHVAVRWGLLMLPSVVMSGLVAFTVSFAISSTLRTVGRKHVPGRLLGPGAVWFLLAGLTNAAAIFSLNSALNLGQVVLVSPLVAVYPVFTLLGSRIFYRSDVITGRTMLGVALIVPSVIAITLWR